MGGTHKTVLEMLYDKTIVTTVTVCDRRSRAALAQPQNQTRASGNNQYAGTPCFQRFFLYSVHSLCIN